MLGVTAASKYTELLAVDGVLYAGVRNAATGAGHVLRWRGSLADPFQFEVVGNVGSDAAELARLGARIRRVSSVDAA